MDKQTNNTLLCSFGEDGYIKEWVTANRQCYYVTINGHIAYTANNEDDAYDYARTKYYENM